MTRIIQLVSLLFLWSCNSTSSELFIQEDWLLDYTATIEYYEAGNQKTQVIYTNFDSGIPSATDTSIIIETYRDTLLLERAQYDVTKGDTLKWGHSLNKYNADGKLIEEIDSLYGILRRQAINFYQYDQLLRTKLLSITPAYNDAMEVEGLDTVRSEFSFFYDETGNCIQTISTSKDKLASALTETTKVDSTLTFNQFDNLKRIIGSITVVNGDTTEFTGTQYDEDGRVKEETNASINGLMLYQYEYDERGNVTSKLIVSEGFGDLTKSVYDEQNRPVLRQTYIPNIPGN